VLDDCAFLHGNDRIFAKHSFNFYTIVISKSDGRLKARLEEAFCALKYLSNSSTSSLKHATNSKLVFEITLQYLLEDLHLATRKLFSISKPFMHVVI